MMMTVEKSTNKETFNLFTVIIRENENSKLTLGNVIRSLSIYGEKRKHEKEKKRRSRGCQQQFDEPCSLTSVSVFKLCNDDVILSAFSKLGEGVASFICDISFGKFNLYTFRMSLICKLLSILRLDLLRSGGNRPYECVSGFNRRSVGYFRDTD